VTLLLDVDLDHMLARPAVRISHHEREIRTATIIVDQAEKAGWKGNVSAIDLLVAGAERTLQHDSKIFSQGLTG
jgi:hypothetical protein